MIDTATGTFVLDGVTPVGPAFTRTAFTRSVLYADARLDRSNDPWSLFVLETPHLIAGDRCSLQLNFEGEKLHRIFLGVIADVKSEGDDYSVDLALAAKARYEAWLAAKLGAPPYEYPWGSIQAVYDPRSVSSVIVVWYRPDGAHPGAPPPEGTPTGRRG